MSEWTIYYNPKCGTCRNTLEILKQAKISPRIVEYLKTPPTMKELDALLKKLRMTPDQVIRSKEPIYDELKLANETSRDKLLRAIADHPVLLQRPIVVRDDRAVVARPAENVRELL